MITPIKYSELTDKFGAHGNMKSLVRMEFPFMMYLSWEKETHVKSTLVHPYIKDDLEEVLEEIRVYYGEAFIYEHNLNEWGGCYNDRQSRGSNRWSTHSWGLAVDYLPSLGGFRKPSLTPAPVVEAFKDHGFIWGGDWVNKDSMHWTGVVE